MPRGKKAAVVDETATVENQVEVEQTRTWDFVAFEFNKQTGFLSTTLPDEYQLFGLKMDDNIPGAGTVLFVKRGYTQKEQEIIEANKKLEALYASQQFQDPGVDEEVDDFLIDDEDDD